jgi:NDP-sugar pyrophosphorylase family protein
MNDGRQGGGPALPAVILAGGRGTRLGALTASMPKPLVDVAGRPVLDWVLTSLARTGVPETLLLVGYRAEAIRAFVGDGGSWGMRASYSTETSPLGTGGAVMQARDRLPEAFLLVYGDSYLPIDYGALSRAFADSAAAAMMVVYADVHGVTGVEPNVAVDGRRVTRYAKGGTERLTHIDAGVVALTKGVIDRLPAGRSALEADLYPALAAAGQLLAYPTPQRFYDAGTPERLRDLERALLA